MDNLVAPVRSYGSSAFVRGVLAVCQLMVTGGGVCTQSPSLDAHSVSSSVHRCIPDQLGGASAGTDGSKAVDSGRTNFISTS